MSGRHKLRRHRRRNVRYAKVDAVVDIREERMEIRLEKTSAGLGLSIAGGLGSTPFKGDDEGIFVSRVTEGGPADVADLKVGDKILSVNGHSMIGVGHYEAVEVLRSAGPVLIIVIIRDVSRLLPLQKTGESAPSSLSASRPPSSTSHASGMTSVYEEYHAHNGPLHHPVDSKLSQLKKENFDIVFQPIYTTLIRDHNGLGFSIAGGKGCPPFRENSDSIYISRITEGGVAEKDGKLQVGDRIISINGVDLEGARHDQAVSMLTGLERYVRLVAEREVLVPKGSGAPSPPPPLEKSPKLFSSVPKPYTSLYNANSHIAAARPPSLRSSTPPNGTSSPPRPAPRRIASQSSTESEPTNSITESGTAIRTKPITNEEFQAMIPSHFIDPSHGGEVTKTGEPTTVVLTIKAPNKNLANGIEFPEAPTTLGKVTETITKSTLTETVVTRVTDNKLAESVIIEEVTLIKDGGSLGFSIIGGTDHSCIPFGRSEPGIFISHIVPGGRAAETGKLRMGDRILKVNGEDLSKSGHNDAVMSLLKPTNELILSIQHDPLPPGFQDLTIVRQDGEKLGMHIKGGLRGHRGNPLDKTDEGVFISKINSGGAAKRDGRLKVGMRLLEVNGFSLLGATHQEAVNTLRNATQKIRMVVCKGYDKSEVERLMSEGKLTKENKSASQSVSSLDREDHDTETIRQQEQEMKQELVAWEKEEEEERKEKEIKESQMEIEEVKDKSTPEKVMEVVRAVEILAHTNDPVLPSKPKSPGGPKSADSLKTTTIVMSKHTLAPQNEQNQTANGSEVKQDSKASVSDRMKFFEKAMEEQHHQSPKPERVFTFLSQDEVEKLKQEEEKKIASLTKNELNVWSHTADDDGEVEDLSPVTEEKTPKLDALANLGPVRTAKAERRRKERLIQEGLLSEDDEKDLSPAEQRALKAEKRAAWRQARLKSLEQDALQAQMVIKKMTEMIDSKTIENDDTAEATIINNNKAIIDHENNVPEVETTREKIISLELSTPGSVENEVGAEDGEEGEEEATTPTTEEHSTSNSKKRRKKKSKKGKH